MATNKEKLGQTLEDLVKSILRNLFPETDGYRIKSPDKKHYNNHNGVDFKVFHHNKEVLALECKNWRKMGYKYGTDTAQTEVINRFQHVGTNLKITVLSFLEVFNNNALSTIKSNGIKLIETAKLVGHKDFRTELYRNLLTQIQRLYRDNHHRERVLFNNTSQSLIPNYCSMSKSLGSEPILNNYIPTVSTHHTTSTEPSNNRRFPASERFPYEPRFT